MFSDIGEKTVQEAQAAIREDLAKIDPLLTKVFLMARALLHGVINRFKVTVHFEILPDPGPNPDPDART